MGAILLDACVPQWLRSELGDGRVTTARYAGLDQLSDTDLLTAIEGRFHTFVTLDRNLSYQNKVAGRRIAVIELRVAEQTPEAFRALIPAFLQAFDDVEPGEVLEIGD